MELIKRRYEEILDQDAKDFIDYAVDGASRMKQLINDLLSFSRVTTRGRDFAKSDMNKIIKAVKTDLGPMIEENNANIYCKKFPEISVDESQIRQVFQNLINNAIKFKRKNIPPKIYISVQEEGQDWLISVKDNGIGIDEKYKEKVFVIFSRLHNKGVYEGTGIGLALTKRIINRHGGKIWFESELGKGTTFKFTLPK